MPPKRQNEPISEAISGNANGNEPIGPMFFTEAEMRKAFVLMI
jgi:hypothetical protein